VGFLDDPSPFVAMEAAQALAMYGAREDARKLVGHLDRFQDWNREHLVSLLRGLGARVGPELRAMVDESEPVPSPTRAVAVEALRAFHDLESVDLTPHVLSTESDPDILTATLRLVAELGQPAHLEAVRPHLASPHFAVRAAAFQALGALGGRDDLAQLRAGVDDPSPWVARQAARGLRSCGGRETLRALVEAGHARATLAAEVLAEEPA
jgi:HEAT repeat protein